MNNLYIFRLLDALQTYEDCYEKENKVDCVGNIPDDILLKHLYHFWKAVVAAYQKKREDL